METVIEVNVALEPSDDLMQGRSEYMGRDAARGIEKLSNRLDDAVAPFVSQTIKWDERFGFPADSVEYDTIISSFAPYLVAQIVGAVEAAALQVVRQSSAVPASCHLDFESDSEAICVPCKPEGCHKIDGKIVDKCPGKEEADLLVYTTTNSRGESVEYAVAVHARLQLKPSAQGVSAPRRASNGAAWFDRYFSSRPLDAREPQDNAVILWDFYRERQRPPFWDTYNVKLESLRQMLAFFAKMRDLRQQLLDTETAKQLTFFLLDRIGHRIEKKEPPLPQLPDGLKDACNRLSEAQLAAFDELGELVQPALDCFAAGNLTAHNFDVPWTGQTADRPRFAEPDGALFFAWAEFALLPNEKGAHKTTWGGLLPTLLRAQAIFINAYGSSLRPPKGFFSYSKNSFGVVTPDAVKDVKYTDVPAEQLASVYQQMIQDACPAGMAGEPTNLPPDRFAPPAR